MYVYSPGGVEAGTPDEVEELIAVKGNAGKSRHRRQKVELFRRQRQLSACRSFAVREARSTARSPGADDFTVRFRLATCHPSQDGIDSRYQLVRVERLRHVVVRAQPQTRNLVDVGSARGKEDDRHATGRESARQT